MACDNRDRPRLKMPEGKRQSYAGAMPSLNCYHRGSIAFASRTMSTAATMGARIGGLKDVWLISAGHGLTHWYTATFYLLLPLIGKELGLSYTEIGLIMTVQHLAGAISNLPGGMIVDIIGQKGYLMAASLFWTPRPLIESCCGSSLFRDLSAGSSMGAAA